MNRIILAAGLASLAAAPLHAASLDGATGYSLGDNGNTLVTMADLYNPGAASGMALTLGGNPFALSALAYRPMTGQLYGYSDGTNSVYELDTMTGATSFVASASDAGGTATSAIGFDFNNFLDAARIVSVADDNLVFFPNNTPPNVARFTSLFYAAGDVNEGFDPSVFANAYTNAVPNPGSTAQFVLDGDWDLLAALANNLGVLTTIGKIYMGDTPLDFTNSGGFDIYSPMDGENYAVALLTTATGVGLYEIDLMADAQGRVQASYLGMAGTAFGPLDGLAVVPSSVIPLPAPAFLLAAGFAGLAALRRRA